jgi:hypothetical protein
MTMQSRLGAALAGAALAAALEANAATLPQPKTENGVTYVNGGIGEAEAAAMKTKARHYPMSLIFSAGKDNAYLADVKITITDKSGKALLSTAAGPIMLVNLPAGTYAIAAERDGMALHRTVHLGTKANQQIVLHWPKA